MPLTVENAKRTPSTDYCTRLEQGLLPHVSEPVLASVARALGLDDAEWDHLFALALLAPSACSVEARPARSAPVPVHRIPQPPPDWWLLRHYGSPDTSHHTAPPSRTTTSALRLQGGDHVAVATREKRLCPVCGERRPLLLRKYFPVWKIVVTFLSDSLTTRSAETGVRDPVVGEGRDRETDDRST
ncbi:helix-turn-helix transcriptional regulator [Streptomyces sp. 12257]|nr:MULTISPECIES: helix-turn-helix transcriptional regulator [Streptomyces]MDI5911670.1 helix-turn-helix transcriptional regulator [Streptomyces sp. 12257]